MAQAQQKTEEKIVEQKTPQRAKRVPFGVPKSKLEISQGIPGYHLHWINDSPGRVHEAQAGGYEFVTPSEVGWEQDGTEQRVKKRVGLQEDGSAMNAYLMKIRQDWYEEDQQKIQAVQDQFDDAIRRGTLNEQNTDKRYVPKEGIKIR